MGVWAEFEVEVTHSDSEPSAMSRSNSVVGKSSEQ